MIKKIEHSNYTLDSSVTIDFLENLIKENVTLNIMNKTNGGIADKLFDASIIYLDENGSFDYEELNMLTKKCFKEVIKTFLSYI